MKAIAVGSDDAGSELRAVVVSHLCTRGFEVADYGSDDPALGYPSVAFEVASRIADGTHERAILMCGTGIGVSIVANKVPGVFAALCHDSYSAQRARKSNDAQVLAMGARVVGVELARTIIDSWLDSEFEGGRSTPKVQSVRAIDKRGRLDQQRA